jgi:hypothetical protein
VATRPEPTIYGNCDSWSFIVGKIPRPSTGGLASPGELQVSNGKLIHNFSTRLNSATGTTCG